MQKIVNTESAWIHAIKYIKKYHNIDLVAELNQPRQLEKFRFWLLYKVICEKFDSMFSSNKIHDFNT